MSRSKRKRWESGAKDPRCPFCKRPVIGEGIEGAEGIYHEECTKPPLQVQIKGAQPLTIPIRPVFLPEVVSPVPEFDPTRSYTFRYSPYRYDTSCPLPWRTTW